jgi:RNA recognition motif-containing protein
MTRRALASASIAPAGLSEHVPITSSSYTPPRPRAGESLEQEPMDRSDRSRSPPARGGSGDVFVTNISERATDDDFKTLFERYGPVRRKALCMPTLEPTLTVNPPPTSHTSHAPLTRAIGHTAIGYGEGKIGNRPTGRAR